MSDKYLHEEDSDEDADAELERLFGRNTNRDQGVDTSTTTSLASLSGLVEVTAKATPSKQLSPSHHGAKQKAVPIFLNNRLIKRDNPDLFDLGDALVCHLDKIHNDTEARAALGKFVSVIYKSRGKYYGLVASYD